MMAEMRKGETIIYDGGQSGLFVVHDESGLFYIMFGRAWTTITPDQAADLSAKLATAAFPFQRSGRQT